MAFNICIIILAGVGVRTIYFQFQDTIDGYIVLAKEQAEVVDYSYKFNTEVKITSEETGKTETTLAQQEILSRPTFIDKRAYILDQYFLSRNSPLFGAGKYFVTACDKYGAPRSCISVVAIARHETDLCKYYMSDEMHNCWGFGGAGTNRWRFNSYEEAIDRVTDVLVNEYGIQYMIDPRRMERRFCGPQAECSGWGSRILNLMQEVDNFSESLGMGRLTEI